MPTAEPDADSPTTARAPGTRLFLLSFTALFLELMIIRWVPSVVEVVAYYANLMLISSFLGLGLGALVSRRGWRLFGRFSIFLVAAVGAFLLCRHVGLSASDVEFRFFAGSPRLSNYLALIAVFVANAALFMPLGERIGELFGEMPPLRAYAFDLGGSLCGTLAFGGFALMAFSPIAGLVLVATLFFLGARRGERLRNLPLLVGAVALAWAATDRGAIWSPYHFITVHGADGRQVDEPPPADLRTRQDPPVYTVKVNLAFYQLHGTVDPSRYSEAGAAASHAASLHGQYMLPYHFGSRPDRVVVVGAGGGMDVEAALLAGASHVDAVEIDPKLIALSRRLNASGIYDRPEVNVVNDDARAFLERSAGGYDRVVFGFLDSQALATSMASIRLDGFVYTVESFRTAHERLNDDGMLVLSFFSAGRPWLRDKLSNMLTLATGTPPLTYESHGKIVLCSPRGASAGSPPDNLGGFLLHRGEVAEIEPATDDWPFLYLREPALPSDYALVIGSLLLISVLALIVLIPRGTGSGELHFMFLGIGFLLLQTKSVIDCALFFGGTWFVTMLVIAGVLLMVLAANLVATRLKGPSRWHYLALFASLIVLHVVPRALILGLPFPARIAWTLLVVPLPIFFAGLIFSTTFRRAAVPSAAFGANLIGATLGGFAEYLGMVIGYSDLSLLVMLAYLASLLTQLRRPSST